MIHIIGAGISGLTLARLLAEKNYKVNVYETRSHIGGNCYDEYDQHGILVHKYGPHFFHTNNQSVVDFLSKFTEWQSYQHQVLADIDNQLIPVPFNLESLRLTYSPTVYNTYKELLLKLFTSKISVSINELKQYKELYPLYEYIYNKVFLNYTVKQWGCTPDKISPDVVNRVPIKVTSKNNYFTDTYQCIPKDGYNHMFNNMVDHPNINLYLNTNIDIHSLTGTVVYTGPIDKLFDYQFGKLEYRSMDFKFEHHKVFYYQPVTTINYPNTEEYTRITEFKHATHQHHYGTTICKEYPKQCTESDIPYYPMFNDVNIELYNKYKNIPTDIIMLGRLATYKYLNMDQAVEQAMSLFEERF